MGKSQQILILPLLFCFVLFILSVVISALFSPGFVELLNFALLIFDKIVVVAKFLDFC